MSDYTDDETPEAETADDTAANTERKNWRRKLEEEAEQGRQAKVEAEAARKELAFLKAGIDLDTPQGKLFAKAYDGAATAEAVKAAAVEYGVIEQATPEVPAAELEAHDRIAAASAGATQPTDEQHVLAQIEQAQSAREVIDVLSKAGVAIDSSKPGNWARSESMGSVPL